MAEPAVRLKLRSRSVIIIPARLASTRLPRKLLLRETGKSLLQHTYEAAQRAQRPLGVCVAADHHEIAQEVRGFGGQVVMTDPRAPSGTDRVAQAARLLVEQADAIDEDFAQAEIIVNVQGDEPEIAGSAIDRAVELLEEYPGAVMSTLATPIRSPRALKDPACVKVVFNRVGKALYFSRSPIPCVRDRSDELLTQLLLQSPPRFFQHLGLYAYRRDFLWELAQTPPTPLEQLEKLEQLRVLESGGDIYVAVVNEPSIGVDTPEDYQAFVRRSIDR